MDNKEFFSILLPKWPECQVWGEGVTEDQAAQIIIRTQSFNFFCNDSEFENLLYSAAEAVGKERWDKSQYLSEKYKSLNLEYLQTDRIASCWIGGPNGWINWNGKIEQFGKNIGKWPDVETVYNEWCLIAETFPFLKLTCQLFNGESLEDDTRAVIQFNVDSGKVTMLIPDGVSTGKKDQEDFVSIVLNPHLEKGCTIEKFKEALKITEDSLK